MNGAITGIEDENVNGKQQEFSHVKFGIMILFSVESIKNTNF